MSEKVTSSRSARGYTIALVSAAILSTTAIFIRYLTRTYGIPALVLAFWREVFVAGTLLLVLGIFRPRLLRIAREFVPFLCAFGLVLAVFNALWTLSVAINGAAVSTVLVYSSAAFTALLGRWFLRERLDAIKIAAVACSLAGCVLVSGALDPAAWQGNWIGILTGIISGLSYTVYSLMGRSAAKRGLNPWPTLLYIFLFASILLLTINLGFGKYLPGAAVRPEDIFWLDGKAVGWGILFLLAAGPTVGGYGLYNVSLGYLAASVVNLIVTIEPVFTILIAYLLLGESLTVVQILGSLLIMGAVILIGSRQEIEGP